MGERAKVARDNMATIFGSKLSVAQQAALAKANFAHLGESLFEIFYILAKPRRLERIIKITGLENLEAALAQQRGAIIFSGHLGNFFLMAAALSRQVHTKFLYRETRQELAAALYAWMRQRLGLEVIKDNPRHLCFFHSLRTLNRGGVIGVLIDQVETGGVYVDFMGQPAGSTKGVANLHLRSGSPLVPVFTHRLGDKTLRVEIAPHLNYHLSGEQEQDIRDITALTNATLGEQVWRYPEQWFWGHRRWRSWRK
jgi:KDO2-lipid IV(A) lauroyltransferase